jgi:hypothetical protein
MEKLLGVKMTDAAIDRINLSPHERATAKATMRKAEAITDGLWRAGIVLSRWARAAIAKPVQSGIEWVASVPNSRFLGRE